MGKIQRGRVNIATGGDQVAVQAGQVGGRRGAGTPPASTQGGEPGRVVNVRAGNARVGVQADVIEGLTIRF